MKKYQKPKLTIFDLSVRNEIAALKYKGKTSDGSIPVAVFGISSFTDLSGEEEPE